MIISNREIVSLILLAIFFVTILFLSSLKKSIMSIIKMILHPKLITPFLLYFVYVLALITIARNFHLWNFKLTKDSIIVTVGIGLPIIINAVKSQSGLSIVNDVTKKTLEISAMIAFYLDLSSLSILGEFLLQVVIIFVSLMLFACEQDIEKYSALKKILNAILTLTMIGMLFYSTVQVTHIWHTLESKQFLLSIFLPIWLPFSILPFAYLLSLYGAIDVAIKMVRHASRDRKLKIRILVAMFFGFHGVLRYASNFTGEWRWALSNLESYQDAKELMCRYRSSIPK